MSSLFSGRPVVRFSEAHDRRSFLRMAGVLGVGAGLVAGGLVAAPGLAAAAPADPTDVDALNFALLFEYLESSFYETALKTKQLTGRDLALITAITDHETTHTKKIIDTIKQLGGTPMKSPDFSYPGMTWTDSTSILTNASALEEIGVAAYHGQVTVIKDAGVFASVASIAGTESRHAASIASQLGANAFPTPIEQHRSKADTLKIVSPLVRMT